MKHRSLLLAVTVVAALGVLLGTAEVATASFPPGPVPIIIESDPTAPDPTPVFVCVWIKVTGPGPHPFTPDPREDRPIVDVEIDIINDGLPPFAPEPVGDAPWGPFNQYELLEEEIFGTTDTGEEMWFYNVGHWYDGDLMQGDVIIVECPDPDVGEDDVWYVHFTTPEPGTVVLLALGSIALIRRRRR